MNTIEVKGRIMATQCFVINGKSVYHFLLNGCICCYTGSLNYRTGDIITVIGHPNDLHYTNNLGEQKVRKQLKVISIKK